MRYSTVHPPAPRWYSAAIAAHAARNGLTVAELDDGTVLIDLADIIDVTATTVYHGTEPDEAA